MPALYGTRYDEIAKKAIADVVDIEESKVEPDFDMQISAVEHLIEESINKLGDLQKARKARAG